MAVLAFPVNAELADGIEAVVHNSVITSYQISMAAEPSVKRLEDNYANNSEALKTNLLALQNDVLERSVENQLILHDFDTAGYSLPESVIDDYIKAQIQERYGDRATLIKTLQEQGMTYEQFRKQMRDQFIIAQMRYKKDSDAPIISPHKIEVYYLDHTNDYQVEAQVKVRMIILDKPSSGDKAETRQLADEILAKIKSGASFTEMAAIYSQGGQTGAEWFDKSALRKELADAAFALNPGDVSGVINTPGACYLLQVEDKRPPHIKPLNDVRADIEKTLLAREQNQLEKQWIDQLKKKTFVRYF